MVENNNAIVQDPLIINAELRGKVKMALQDCLTPLQDVDGYMASAVFDMSGEVLIQHNNSKHDISLIGAHSISIVRAAMKALSSSGLGKISFIQVNAALGTICAVWAVEEQAVTAILLSPDSNLGMTKLLLPKVGDTVGSHIA